MTHWESLPFRDRAVIAVECFPHLNRDTVNKVLEQWSTNIYEDTYYGEQQAIDELMMSLRNASMDEVQLAQERHRITQLVKDKMK